MIAKNPLHPQADYILDLLVAAGHITREQAFQASDIAREFSPSPKAGEPFGYWHQGATEEESDFFKVSDSGHVGCVDCIALYEGPPYPEQVEVAMDAARFTEAQRVDLLAAAIYIAADEGYRAALPDAVAKRLSTLLYELATPVPAGRLK